MSSGSYTSPGLGFCNTGKPNATVRVCESRSGEPRGPGIYLAGLCCTCGTATTRRDDDGLPRHAPPPRRLAALSGARASAARRPPPPGRTPLCKSRQ